MCWKEFLLGRRLAVCLFRVPKASIYRRTEGDKFTNRSNECDFHGVDLSHVWANKLNPMKVVNIQHSPLMATSIHFREWSCTSWARLMIFLQDVIYFLSKYENND